MQSSSSNRARSSPSLTETRAGVNPAARQAADLDAHLGRLLTGSLPLDDFRQWFANTVWEIEAEGSDDTIDLANLVENRLAEYSGGYISQAVLINALRDDVATARGVIYAPAFSASGGQREQE
jgi:hypothetical protein